MTALVTVYVAAIVAGAACLEWPSAIGPRDTNRYGKQTLQTAQNRYGNPTWPNGAAGGWAAPSPSAYGGNIMRHYPVPIHRYQTVAGGGRRRRPNALSDDYYDADAAGPYDPRPYDRVDYAVVRYPSYGGYYGPVSATADDLASAYAAVDDDDDDDALYDDADAASPPYYAAPAISRYPMPPPPPPQPSNRYESTARYPTDKIHKFRKVFMSNPVSPSNAFKSTKERQLYDFWESLINGDLDGMGLQPDEAETRREWPQQRPARPEPDAASSAVSQLYQHLPPVFQQLQQKQRQQQQRQQQRQQQQQQQQQQQPQQEAQQRQLSAEQQRAPPSSASALTASLQSSVASPSSPASSSMSIPRGNLYKQWANGSPLIKRSSAVPPPNDGDDVLQLERLRANATSATAATRPAAAVEGQREYVLPRPAGEKSGLESLLEVIAEGGIRENADENAATAYRKLHQEVKMNKKRSFISDETSLAAQLGALRKN